MAQKSNQQLQAEEATKLRKLVENNPEKFTPAELERAKYLLNVYTDSVRSEDLSADELAAIDPATKREGIRRNYVETMQDVAKNTKAPLRLVQRMPIGAAKAVFDIGLQTLNLTSAALSPFTSPDDPINNKIAATRNRLIAAKHETVNELEKSYYESYGEADTAVTKVVDTLGMVGGEATPYMGIPFKGPTWLSTVLWNGAVGAFAGSAMTAEQHDSVKEQVKEMTYGGLLGAVTSGLLHTKAGLTSTAARQAQKSMQTEYAKQSLLLEKQIQHLTGQPDFSFSMGQITANPFVVGFEVGSAKALARDAQVQRLEILNHGLKLRAQNLRDAGKGPAEIVADLRQTTSDILAGQRQLNNQAFNDGFENVIAHWGDEAITDGKTYLREVQDTIGALSDPMAGGAANKVPAFLKEQEAMLLRWLNPYRSRPRKITGRDGEEITVWDVVDVREADAPLSALTKVETFENPLEAMEWIQYSNRVEGGINSEQTRKLLNSFRQIASGDIPVWEGAAAGSQQAMARRLKSAFLTELEVGAKNPDAINAIKSLRKVYETNVRFQDGLRRKLLSNILGDEAFQGDYSALIRQFANRPESEMRAVRQLLSEEAPDLLRNLQAEAMTDVVRQSMRRGTGKRSLGEVDIFNFGNALTGKEGGPGSFARGLWDETEQLHIARTGKALDTLAETHLQLFPEASAQIAADVGMNVVSQTPEFVTRLLFRLGLTGGRMSKAMNNKEFRDGIIALAENPVGSAKYQYAALLVSLGVAGMEADELEQMRINQEERERETDMRLAP